MSRRTLAMNHVHKYYRLELTGLWHCALCTHYMPTNMGPDPVIGHRSHCWMCDKKFILTPFDMETPKPICSECTAEMAERRRANSKESYIEEFKALDMTLEEFNKLFPKAKLTPEDVGLAPDTIEVIEPDEES